MRLSLKLVLLCVSAVLPAAGIQLWYVLSSREQRTAEVRADAERAAVYAASELERVIGGARQLLTAAASAPSVMERDTERCAGFIARLEAQLPEYARLTVADRTGRLVCVAGNVPPGFGLGELGYFQEAVRSGEFVVGEYSVGRLSGQALLHLALPVRGADGAVDRVAVAALDLRWLSAQLQERGLPPGGSVTIADRHGVIVARAPRADQFVGTRIPDQFLGLLHASAPGVVDVTSQDGTRRMLGYVPLVHTGSGLYVSAGLATERAFSVIDRTTRAGFLLIGVGVLSAMLAALLAGRLFLGPPVRRMLQTMQLWREGKTAARVGPLGGGAELARLAAGFDSMADVLEARNTALHASEERSRLAMDAAGLGTWEVEINNLQMHSATDLFVLFGLDVAADGRRMIEQSPAVIHPDDRDALSSAWTTAFASGVFAVEFRGQRQKSDGILEERWFLARGKVQEGARGSRMIGISLDITERKRAEDRIVLLAREVDHRAKNALAVVQATLRLTPKDDVDTYAEAVEGRVSALARAQTLLAADRWKGADLRVPVEAELSPFVGLRNRVELWGPPILLPPAATQSIAMALHELATNAVKHGALSVPDGGVSVTWEHTDGVIRLVWAETGGPIINGPPGRRGFGSVVLESTVSGPLGGAVLVTWPSTGVVCDITLPLKHGITQAAAE